MIKYRALAWAIAASFPAVLFACGDDDSPPGSTGGGAGEAGDGGTSSGGSSGSRSGGSSNGGSSNGGSSNGGSSNGGNAGDAGSDTGGSAGDGTGGTGGAPQDGCDLTGDGLETETIPSDIEDDLTLANDRVWRLNGIVKVHDGATLTIEPCTRIEGSPAPDPGVLAILRGGRIDAVGSADEPILFTSAQPPGSRTAGQWGGVVLLGRAPIAATSASKLFEGLTDDDFTYGGDDPEDDSGRMSYVRIEFGGWEILPDKEVNGLSMGAVGSATELDHIMVSNTQDDCFEWWGGTVEANYLICNNAGDDMFDADEGYVASGRHWFGRRTSDVHISSGDPGGFEWDGTEGGASLTPRTNITATNVTLCGTGEAISSGGGNPEYGMVFRELAMPALDNVALLGFEFGIDVRDFEDGDGSIENSLFWELSSGVGDPDTGNDDDAGFDDASLFEDGDDNEVDPDPAPFSLANCLAANGPTSAVKESDVGAFAGDETWMDGLWVDWSED